jgi:hypothetical protein
MTKRSPVSFLSNQLPQAHPASIEQSVPPLTVEQLEEGLRKLDRGEIEPNLFWDQNMVAFRQTVLVAIRETSDGLARASLSAGLRAELESQVEPLNFYLRIADCYLAKRRQKLN